MADHDSKECFFFEEFSSIYLHHLDEEFLGRADESNF